MYDQHDPAAPPPLLLEHSESFAKVFAALAASQAAFPAIEKTKEARVTPREGKQGYTFWYAPLGGILAAVTPVLSKNGLALTQPWVNDGQAIHVQTLLVHAESGEWIRTRPATYFAGNQAKDQAGVVTYVRRYQLKALLGLEPDDDVDQGADEVQDRATARRAPPAPPPADRTLEPGQDPASMTGGSEEPARPDPAAAARAAIAEKRWPDVVRAIGALPQGQLRKQLQDEYQAARYPRNGSTATA